jgi:Ca2+/Na+ antiporter
MTTQQRNLTVAVLVVIGVIALAVGIIYLTVAAKSLPSILGQIHHASGHRSKRGIAALVVGAVLLAAGAGVALYKPRSYS